MPDNKVRSTKYFGNDKKVYVPNNIMHYTVTEIGMSTFEFNANIVEVVLPPTVEKIEKGSFSECVMLERINIPPLVTRIECMTFDDCIRLETVVLENKSCIIEDGAFINFEPKFV